MTIFSVGVKPLTTDFNAWFNSDIKGLGNINVWADTEEDALEMLRARVRKFAAPLDDETRRLIETALASAKAGEK